MYEVVKTDLISSEALFSSNPEQSMHLEILSSFTALEDILGERGKKGTKEEEREEKLHFPASGGYRKKKQKKTRKKQKNLFCTGFCRIVLQNCRMLHRIPHISLRTASRKCTINRYVRSVHRLRPEPSSSHPLIRVEDFVVTAPHSRMTSQTVTDYTLAHSIYTPEEMEHLQTDTHYKPKNLRDKFALSAISFVRKSFDMVSGYDPRPGHMTEEKYLVRTIFLETVAGVPGMVGGTLRHLRSLRTLEKDHGWIHQLL